MILALKLKDTEGSKMKNVCAAYHKTIAKVEEKESEIMDEEIYSKIKERIIVHEAKLLKVLSFQFEIPLPYYYVEKVMRKNFKDDKEKNKQLYHLSRIIILDTYRTHACLTFKSQVIAMSGILLAANILGFELPPGINAVLAADPNLSEEEVKELENKQFEKWIQENEVDIQVSELNDCLEVFRDFFEMYEINPANELIA